MNREKIDAGRLAGTVVVAIATTVVIAAGYVGLWLTLISHLRPIIGIPAMLGLVAAPFQLVSDLLRLDRTEGKTRREDLDRTRLQPAAHSGADAGGATGSGTVHQPVADA